MSIYLDTSKLVRVNPQMFEVQNELIRSGKGNVLRFGQPDVIPAGEVFVEVVGEAEKVGAKSFTPKIRGVVGVNGDQQYIGGGQGEPVQFEDAQKLLHSGDKKSVTITMKKTADRMRRKLTNATKS